MEYEAPISEAAVVQAAVCETDEQGSSVLGLAVQQQWLETRDLVGRGR